MVMEDDSPAEPASGSGTLRNLSAWSINIPNIHSYDDELKREKIPVFCIDVERHDRKEGENNGLKNRRRPPKLPWQRLALTLKIRQFLLNCRLVCLSGSSDRELVRVQTISGILRSGVQTDRVPR